MGATLEPFRSPGRSPLLAFFHNSDRQADIGCQRKNLLNPEVICSTSEGYFRGDIEDVRKDGSGKTVISFLVKEALLDRTLRKPRQFDG